MAVLFHRIMLLRRITNVIKHLRSHRFCQARETEKKRTSDGGDGKSDVGIVLFMTYNRPHWPNTVFYLAQTKLCHHSNFVACVFAGPWESSFSTSWNGVPIVYAALSGIGPYCQRKTEVIMANWQRWYHCFADFFVNQFFQSNCWIYAESFPAFLAFFVSATFSCWVFNRMAHVFRCVLISFSIFHNFRGWAFWGNAAKAVKLSKHKGLTQ